MPQPIAKSRAGLFSASVFNNISKDKKRTFKSIQLQKGYQREGSWYNQQISIFPDQIDMIISCLNDVKAQLNNLENKTGSR